MDHDRSAVESEEGSDMTDVERLKENDNRGNPFPEYAVAMAVAVVIDLYTRTANSEKSKKYFYLRGNIERTESLRMLISKRNERMEKGVASQ